MLNAGVSAAALAAAVQVDPKTVARWITEDRIPYPMTRVRITRVLEQHETFLWPALLQRAEDSGFALAELDHIWPTRSAVSSETWHALFSRATRQLDILVYAGGFLIETLDLRDVLGWKASNGTAIRVLVGDPECTAVRMRAAEISLPWLPDRCRTTMKYLADLRCQAEISVRTHRTTLYASQFRFDDTLLVNAHAFGAWASSSPVFQLQRCASGQLFDFYASAFECAWSTTNARSA
jgi:hypothetical protein